MTPRPPGAPLGGGPHLTPDLAPAVNLYPRLTVRRAQVWREIVRGSRDHEIAATLNVSVDSVKTFKRALYGILPTPRDQAAVAMHGLRTGAFTLAPWDPAYLKRPLTPREVDVVWHVAEGMSDGETADALGLARDTIRSHMRRIAEAVGTGRRTMIATRLYRAGIIT